MLLEPRYSPARGARILVVVGLEASVVWVVVVMELKGEKVGLEETEMLALALAVVE